MIAAPSVFTGRPAGAARRPAEGHRGLGAAGAAGPRRARSRSARACSTRSSAMAASPAWTTTGWTSSSRRPASKRVLDRFVETARDEARPPGAAGPLETVFVTVPEDAVEAYEAALTARPAAPSASSDDEDARTWRIEGVRDAVARRRPLAGALAWPALLTGIDRAVAARGDRGRGLVGPHLRRLPRAARRRRFLVQGTHALTRPDALPAAPGRLALTLDAGLAFGSGEHGSTRGCLRALERVARRRPRRILDLGTGSGILAMAAAKLLHRPVLATDIEPWSVRVAGQNAVLNGVGPWCGPLLADGWRARTVQAGRPYDLVFANILARPLCRMARDLAAAPGAGRHRHPGGPAGLAGGDGAGGAPAPGAGAGAQDTRWVLDDAHCPQAPSVRLRPWAATRTKAGVRDRGPSDRNLPAQPDDAPGTQATTCGTVPRPNPLPESEAGGLSVDAALSRLGEGRVEHPAQLAAVQPKVSQLTVGE